MLDPLVAVDLGDELTWEPMRIVPPDPWTGHLPFAFWLIKALRPATLVELGTHSGNSYFAFCQAMAAFTPAGRAYAVDTWAGDEHAGHYDESVFAGVSGFNGEHFRQFSTLLRTTFDEARAYFPPASVDLLHIDGMHTYDAVRQDFETWRDALSSRAVVVFHDTNVRERDFGVWRFWQELSAEYPSFEFDHSNGLGVLGVGPDQPPMMQALFALSKDAAAAGTLRRRLAARGEAFQRQVTILDLRTQLTDAVKHAQRAVADAQAQQGGLEWRDALLKGQREIIQAKDMMIAALGNVVAGRAQSLAVRDRLIESRDMLAAQLMHDVRHQQFLTSEERRVRAEMQAGYEGAIQGLNAHHEGQQRNAALAVEQARQQLALAGPQLEQVQQQTAATVTQFYVGSRSWKIGRPLRVAARLLRGRGLAPAGPALPPLPSLPPIPAVALPEPAPADATATDVASDVTAVTPLKQAMRALLSARLQAFLAGPETLRLPCAAQPDVSIILVLYNQAELTFGCLGSIIETLAHASFGVEVVIVDNHSTDDTAALLDRLEGATVIRNSANLHFLKAVNLAARSARGRTILLLNNDAQLLPGALASALRTLDSDAAIGAVGGRIILPDGTLQEAGSIIWRDGACSGYARGQDPHTPDVMFQRNVDYCSGAFLLTPTALFRAMGGFDERFAPAYYEETDYCVRLWEGGHRVVYDPDATIIHYEFGSSTQSGDALRLQAANHAIFAAQHREWLDKQFPASPLNLLAARTARTEALRILVLEDRVPKVELGTGYPRANRLLHEMVEAGAEVTLFPMFRHKEDWHGVRLALDKRIEVLISADRYQLRDYLVARPNQFDAILVCRPPNMEAFLEAVGPERGLLGGAAVLYDAEALFVTRTLQRRATDGDPVPDLERHKLVAAEVSLTRIAKAVISVTPAEQEVLEDYGAPDVHILGHALDDAPIPTGYDARDQIVFLGAIQEDSAPNAEAVRWFAESILPPLRQALGKPDFRLTVVGLNKAKTIAAMDGDTLELVGMVESLPPALARARVMVVPSRLGAGIPHKVHQAAMLGIPMVVTGLIASQLGWDDGTEILVADDPGAFAAACARLYDDPALWERVRDNALIRARQDCAPEVFTAKVRTILASLDRVHREPEPVPLLDEDGKPIKPPAAPPPPPTERNTSRPAESDWSVAVPFSYTPIATEQRLGVIAHVFHVAVAKEMLFYLHNIPVPADLCLSTDTAEKQAELQAIFGSWDKGSVEVRVTPNRGRDIAPKLVGFADVYDRYDLVLHLHSKVSTHAAFLAPWRSYLFETLLGSPEIVRSILDGFGRVPDLGMVAPQHYQAIRRWLGWNGNFEGARAMAARMGLSLSPRRALDFPSGSMFWARPAALRPLLDLGLTFEDFPEEGEQVDHTPAHVIERLYFYSCEKSGHTWLKVTEPTLCFDTATVVEIASPIALSQFIGEHGVVLSGPGEIATRKDPAPMMTRVAPGLNRRLAARSF
jgi:GT2 family glycosyltransferase